jgi:hypothetical protein
MYFSILPFIGCKKFIFHKDPFKIMERLEQWITLINHLNLIHQSYEEIGNLSTIRTEREMWGTSREINTMEKGRWIH